jgi:hypothetical protein
MAKESLQDKFQLTVPYNPNDDSSSEGDGWVWAQHEAIRPRPMQGGYSDGLISEFSLGPKKGDAEPIPVPGGDFEVLNQASARNNPPNVSDLQEWVVKEHRGLDLTLMSESDITNSVVATRSLINGFTLHDMGNTDDQYSGEGMDHFYGDAQGEDDGKNKYTGFVERNNYLDRNAIAWLSLLVMPLLLSLGSASWST